MEIQPEIVGEWHKMVKDSKKGISLEEKARENMYVQGVILCLFMDKYCLHR